MTTGDETSLLSASSHSITVPIHGRYLVATPKSSAPAPLLVGFHGYGEHAECHLANLNRIPGSNQWVRVAVQGLHRFYSASGKHTVASWMTRQDRELAIADNLGYINEVVRAVKKSFNTSDTLVYCGFSQGVSMAYRAATRGNYTPAGVVALSGDVPPELKNDPTVNWPPVLIGRGHTDEWYTEARMKLDVGYFNSMDIEVESLGFAGGHEWTDVFRTAVGRFLAARR